MTDQIYSGAYEWNLDESGNPESEALAGRSADEGITIYGTVDGEPATAFRGSTYLRGARTGGGSTGTQSRIADHLDE